MALPLDYAVISSEDITTGAVSAASSAAPAGTTHVRLATTVACRFVTGETPTAVATSPLLPTNYVGMIKIPVGWKVAALQEGSAGKLSVAFIKASRL